MAEVHRCISCNLIDRVIFSSSVTFLSPFLFPVVVPRHPAYPGAEGRHFGIHTGRLLRPAGVTPGGDPVNHPTPSRTLAHQRASAVAPATVHAALFLDAAGTEHAAREGLVEMELAVAAGKEGEGGLLKSLGVRAA